MSGALRRRRAPKDAERATTIATNTSPTIHNAFGALRRPPATFGVLPSIGHPPDLATVIVAHQQGSIRQYQETNRPAPARAVRTLPPHDEVFNPHGAPAGAVDFDTHDLCARRHAAAPGTVQRDERIAAILARKLGPRVKR